ncbi:MAG: L-threonylcarbamoyladenylate synthase [Burkholderiales bacterium]
MISPPTTDTLARAARLLRDGALVAFPTETVYGLGADAGNEAAVRAIFAAKGRPADHPVIVHVEDLEEATRWAGAMPRGARLLAQAFWPGPLTLIVPRAAHVPDAVTGGQDSVGLRVPSHPVARALLRAFAVAGGRGIAAPSANRFGRISPTTAQHVRDDLGEDVALIVDGGPCDVGIESTIVAFTGETPLLLRPGGIGADALARVLGGAVGTPTADAPRASGTLASHYAPRTPSRIAPPGSLSADGDVAVLARTVAPKNARWIAAPPDARSYAHDLYANLRALDAMGARAILIEDVPPGSEWDAVRDRLARATRGEDDDRD